MIPPRAATGLPRTTPARGRAIPQIGPVLAISELRTRGGLIEVMAPTLCGRLRIMAMIARSRETGTLALMPNPELLPTPTIPVTVGGTGTRTQPVITPKTSFATSIREATVLAFLADTDTVFNYSTIISTNTKYPLAHT